MIVWLFKDGELLPVQRNARKMRTWMLAEFLVERGHTVVWWSSTFSHQFKQLLFSKDTEVEVEPRFLLKMLHSGSYRNNVSIARMLHHWNLSRKFLSSSPHMPVPDVIVCAYPTIELAYNVYAYARMRNVPFIIDIQDPWPDTFLAVSPWALKPLVWILVRYQLRKAREVMANADRIVSVSAGFLKWGQDLAGRTDWVGNKVFHIGCPSEGRNNKKYAPSERIRGLCESLRGKSVFTFIGSFGYSYELELVLDVAERLLGNGFSKIHFVLAGDGQKYGSLRRRARSLPNVSLPGWLDRSEIQQILASSHVGLVPILNIGRGTFPNKPFEYFACGLPVLSSLKGEIEELIAANEIGFNYSCGNLEGLYQLVLKLAGDEPLRKRLGDNAKRIFNGRFRTDLIYAAYASYIEEVAWEKGQC